MGVMIHYYRRAALRKWKEMNGKTATYNNLITVFEAVGHKDYADYIRKEFGDDDEDTDDSSDDESYPRPQPPAYPIQQYYDPIVSSASSEPSNSLSELYNLVDPDTAKMLPEGRL